MSTGSIHDVLAQSEMCADVSADTVTELARASHRFAPARGQIVIAAGQESENLYLIAAGAIRLAFPNVTGNEKTIATLDAGKIFGLAELYSGRPYRYNAEASAASTLISIPGPAMLAAGDRDARLLRNLIIGMSRHFDALAHDIEYSIRFSAFQRVVNFLLGRAEKTPNGAVVVTLANKSMIASRLGIAPETLSRGLATLSERGLIEVDRSSINLLDSAGLGALLQMPPNDPI